MKNYNFLFKPLFFIFSLVFATWLVFYIEKISPSDFGKYESLFKTKTNLSEKEIQQVMNSRGEKLKKICADYKAGIIDSTQLDKELKEFLRSIEKDPAK
jgi:hypothetical protein